MLSYYDIYPTFNWQCFCIMLSPVMVQQPLCIYIIIWYIDAIVCALPIYLAGSITQAEEIFQRRTLQRSRQTVPRDREAHFLPRALLSSFSGMNTREMFATALAWSSIPSSMLDGMQYWNSDRKHQFWKRKTPCSTANACVKCWTTTTSAPNDSFPLFRDSDASKHCG